jgi:hypothetical protein
MGCAVLDGGQTQEPQQQETPRPVPPRGQPPRNPPIAAAQPKQHDPAQSAQQETALRDGPPAATTLESPQNALSRSSSSPPLMSGVSSPEGQPSTSPKTTSSPLTTTDGQSPEGVTSAPPKVLDDRAEEAKRLLEQEEERRRQRKSRRGRLRELEEIRSELAIKELVLLEKQAELQEKEQTLTILREEVGSSCACFLHRLWPAQETGMTHAAGTNCLYVPEVLPRWFISGPRQRCFQGHLSRV